MHLKDLKRKTPAELVAMAEELGVEGASTMRRQDLLFSILRELAEDEEYEEKIMGIGTIEVLQDGFGFLRSPEANYLAGPDDIYVSPNQVRKWGLRTGDTVEGEIRAPKEGERYFALTSLTSVNFDDPDAVRHRTNFDNLTPLYPEEKLSLDTLDPTVKDKSARVIDIISPQGKGQRALIVAPPRTGKTVLLQNIAKAITDNHPEVFLLVLLGIFDYCWQMYAQQVLQGVVAKAGRDATLEGFAADQSALDARVEAQGTTAERGRGDADADFLRAQAGGGKDRRLRLDRREGDDAGGIARQQEGIGARRPVEQRDEGAEPKPQRQCEREKFGGIAEQRHQQDRHARADDGAEQAEHRLGRHCAGERLGDDIGGDDRPIGPVQPDPQRDIIGQHRREKGLEREQRIMAAVAIGHPARLRQGRRHAAHPASSGGARQGGDAGRENESRTRRPATPDRARIAGASGKPSMRLSMWRNNMSPRHSHCA